MTDQGGFQEQVKHLSESVAEFEQLPDSPHKTAGKELVRLLMDVHAQSLERMMELIFANKESGTALIDQFGKDELVGPLLLLYSLHPDALETRIQTAIDRLRPRMRKLSCAIDVLSVEQGVVRVRITRSGHSCGSSSAEVRGMVENVIYEIAPDITSLEVVDLEEQVAGFVALETLLTPALATGSNAGHHTGNGR